MDGMITKYEHDGSATQTVGDVLRLWLELRKRTGTLEAKKKEGVRFKVRSAEEMIDKIRGICNELGILIYPVQAHGKGHPLEEGTLADVELTIVVQAVSDGSKLAIAGFGLGADTQDKAGGKAGTYAFKQAIVQALLMGGKENAKALGVVDTDDTDAPIVGGVRKPSGKPTTESVKAAFRAATDADAFAEAAKAVRTLSPEKQLAVRADIIAAQERLGLGKKTQEQPQVGGE